MIQQANPSGKPEATAKEIKKEAAILRFRGVLFHKLEVISGHEVKKIRRQVNLVPPTQCFIPRL